MSTSPIQANLAPSWKQEVNRRVAAHRNRSNVSEMASNTAQQVHPSTSSRAAQAAARVAARFAKAPSYSEVLADEARAAVRAAEAASRAALEAQAAAESVLAGLEAHAAADEPAWEPEPEPATVAPEPRVTEMSSRISYAVRWEPDFPVRSAEPEPVHAMHGAEVFDSEADEWHRSRQTMESAVAVEEEEIQPVEPAQPIHANLIEFPRELIAPRKARPRLAEAAAHPEPGGQLSIFEVDPAEISTEPAAAVEVPAEPAWQEPEWTSIKLDAEPAVPALVEPVVAAPAAPESELELAPVSRRLLALVVDGALVTSAFLGAAYLAARNMAELPAMRTAEISAAVALAVIAVMYVLLFFTLAKGTPGMKYARVRLSTLDGQNVTRTQRLGRLGAMVLSLLPLGLGVAWSLFDEDRLCWHDRLSGTYLKRFW